MYQGQELSEKLNTIYAILNRYADITNEVAFIERQLMDYKKYIETKTLKGKANITMATGVVVLAVITLLLSLIYRDFGNVLFIAIVLIVHFGCRNIYPKISKVAAGILVFLTVMQLVNTVELAVSGYWGEAIFLVIALPIGIAVMVKTLKVNRSYVDSHNEAVREHNAPYIQKYQELCAESQALDTELRFVIQGWYPPDYVNMAAVEFFIDAVRKGRADSMKELANLYEKELQHKEIVALTKAGFGALIDGQNDIKQQLYYSNMLGLYQIYQLDDIRKWL